MIIGLSVGIPLAIIAVAAAVIVTILPIVVAGKLHSHTV